MGLGGAIVGAILKILFGYLIWVAIVIFLIVRYDRNGKNSGMVWFLVLLIVAPPLVGGLMLQRRIASDKERQRRDTADLAEAREMWKSICQTKQVLVVSRRSDASRSQILIRDSAEEMGPTYADFPVSVFGKATVFSGSPFASAVERVAIRGDDRLCKSDEKSFQCKHPTHAFRVWRGYFEMNGGAESWEVPPKFALKVGALKPTSNRYIETHSVILTEDEDPLVSAEVSYFAFDENHDQLYCPDRHQIVEEMIREVFGSPERSTAVAPATKE